MSLDNWLTDSWQEKTRLSAFLERNNQLQKRIQNQNMIRRTPDNQGNYDKDGSDLNNQPELVFYHSSVKNTVTSFSQPPVPKASLPAPGESGHHGGKINRRASDATSNKINLGIENRMQRKENPVANDISKNSESPKAIDVEKVADKVYRLMQRDLILERDRIPRPGG